MGAKIKKIISIEYSPTFEFESQHPSPVAGLDEAGCGAWAGPVTAAAVVILPTCPSSILAYLNDSKRLTAEKREEVFELLFENLMHFHIGIGTSSVEEIETINIRAAALLAMKRAFEGLPILPAAALVDGNVKPALGCQTAMIIKGDQRSYSIAAASIVAKVTRDQFMKNLAQDHPQFGWETNAGYGTKDHQKGLAEFGLTPWHRKTYKPIASLVAEQTKKKNSLFIKV